jgi:lysophospholipase L1-like esterase
MAPIGPPLLALGDSIAFGFNPNLPTGDPSRYIAYSADVAAAEGLTPTNMAQPGETTGSFLDMFARNNGGWIPDPNDPSKRVHEWPLHTNYDVDQCDAAVGFLKQHPDTKLVTLTLGGNDLLLVQKDAGTGLMSYAKEALALPGTELHLYENLKKGLDKIRSVYSGSIVVTDVYAPDYSNTFNTLALKATKLAIEGAVASVNKPGEPAKVADVYGSFDQAVAADPQAKGSTGAAGLLLTTHGGYDVHPSPEGRQLIAKTVENTLASI